MNSEADWKATPAGAWATWENIAESVLPIVDKEHVARLARRRGDLRLDAATGSGAVALPAARAGAQSSALELAPASVRRARRHAAKHGLHRLAAARGIRAGQDRSRRGGGSG